MQNDDFDEKNHHVTRQFVHINQETRDKALSNSFDEFTLHSEENKLVSEGILPLPKINENNDSNPCKIQYNVHKLVLAINSPYFKNMFQNNWKDSENKIIKLSYPITQSSLETIIDYMYSGEVFLSGDSVQELLPAANLLQLTWLQETCCMFLKKQLQPINAIGIHKFSKSYNCVDLENIAKGYILANFKKVFLEEEFLELDLDIFEEIVKSDELYVENEDQVFYAIIKWCNNREEFLKQLLCHVRLPFMTKEVFLKENQETESHAVKNFIIDVLRYQLLSSSLPFEKTKSNKNFTENEENPIITQQESDNNNQNSENTPESDAVLNDSYNNSDQLNNSENIDENIQDISTSLESGVLHQFQQKYNLKPRCPTSMPKSLIIIGGQSPKAVNRVEYLNLQRDLHELNWESGKIPRLPYRCCRAGVVQDSTKDNEIYVVGGFSGSHRLRTAMKFNWKNEKWETLSFQMKSRRSTCAAAILDDKLYAVGGFDGSQGLSSCEVLDLKGGNGWVEISSLL